MKSNILFVLAILGIIITYVICYKLFTESLSEMATQLVIPQPYTIEMKEENEIINIGNKNK
jgi:hypothetical protein